LPRRCFSLQKKTAVCRSRSLIPNSRFAGTVGKFTETKDFDRIVQEERKNTGVESSLIKAVIQTESSGNPWLFPRPGSG